jgi:hypothetical protein
MENTTPLFRRLFYYLILAVLCKAVPYIVTIILIIATGDRIEGMKLGVIPGLILPQMLFGFLFINIGLVYRILLTCASTILIYWLVVLSLSYEQISTNFDNYGYWDLAITNVFVGIIIWEMNYHIIKITKRYFFKNSK